ncbi:hypothetical protein ACFL5H_02905 [Candidatus Latescibacterota bacterium]
MLVLFILCFVLSEIMVTHFIDHNPVKRFILRIAFLVQYSILISFLFRTGNSE